MTKKIKTIKENENFPTIEKEIEELTSYLNEIEEFYINIKNHETSIDEKLNHDINEILELILKIKNPDNLRELLTEK